MATQYDSYNQKIAVLAVEATNPGITTKPDKGIFTREIPSSVLKPLLNSTTNVVTTFGKDDYILDVILEVTTAHGSPVNIDVGVDATLRAAGASANYVLDDALGGTAGNYRASGGSAPLAGGKGIGVAAAGGGLTVTSASDISGGAFVGRLIIVYARN